MRGPGTAARIDAAATLLLRARRPLVYGLQRATVEAQRRAVGIAELTGGVIDPASSASHGASLLAFQRVGHVSATLGELRERADLIVYWGVDPDVRSPGFQARYVEGGVVPARVTVAVGIRERHGPPDTAEWLDHAETRGPLHVDDRFDIDAAFELEALWILRARLRGRRVELAHTTYSHRWREAGRESGASPPSASPQRGEAGRGVHGHADTQLPLPALNRLATHLRRCRYGVILHDADPPPERRDPMPPLALGALAIEANRMARVRLIGVRRPGNAVGAETVLTWQTGFPFAVDFSRGYPRYGAGEFTAERLLARGEVDAALLVGVEPPIDLSGAAVAHLERIPTIVIGGPGAWSAAQTRARFTTSPFEALAGSIYRMDGVALRRHRSKHAGQAFRSATSSERDAAAPLPTSPRWGEEPRASEPEDAAVLSDLCDAIQRRLSDQDSARSS